VAVRGDGGPGGGGTGGVAAGGDAGGGEAGGRVLWVWQLTRYLKEMMDSDPFLTTVWVRGEVSNFKHHSSGHMYFTLKDERSSLRCVMFRAKNERLRFAPQDGERVVASGYVSIYERDGSYQLYVEDMRPDGLGALHQAFLRLKEKLEKDGLFDPARKRRVPLLPRKVGVITSLTGAAIRDIVTVARRRMPNVHLVIAPVLVQGDEAPPQLCRALDLMNRVDGVEVIIIGRGGGSLEELWAFNDENLARRIFASRVPVISAVGHETDVTIADLVADLRAPTPSAAAELAVPDRAELEAALAARRARLKAALRLQVGRARQRLLRLVGAPVLARPRDRVYQARQRVDDLTRRLGLAASRVGERKRARHATLAARLQALSPLAVLGRGYSICRRIEDGRVVMSVEAAAAGDGVGVVVRDGELLCEVRGKGPGLAQGA